MSEFKFASKGLDYAKSQTDEFHKAFGHKTSDKPTLLTPSEVSTRVSFIAEELVELLAAVSHSEEDLYARVTELIRQISEAESKEIKAFNPNKTELEQIVAIADGLTDINYFNQGTFSMCGIEPQPLMNIVHFANMSKLGPDNKPIYRESDGKIMKPEGWVAPEPMLEKEIIRQMEEK
jgi:predicted HAD superfamily Cof-like phosphohydrolase